MTAALRAEWTKLRTVRGTTWSVLALLGLTVLLTAIVCSASDSTGCPPGSGECADLAELSRAGVYIGQFAVAALAATAIGSEYATGMIRATFAADPRRRTVLAAKAIAIAVLVLGVALVAVVASCAIGRALLAGNGFTTANGYREGAVLRPVAGSALYLTAIALLGFGLAAVFRSTAAAITTVTGLMWLPIFAPALLPERAAGQVLRATPMAAGLAIQRTVEGVDPVPIAPWAGLAVAFAWAALALAAATWLIGRRDV
jgi:ABC-2 type transport system permease protein